MTLDVTTRVAPKAGPPICDQLKGSLVVHVSPDGPPEALRLAVALAQASGAWVMGVGAEMLLPAWYCGRPSLAGPALEGLRDEIAERLGQARLRFQAETRSLNGRVVWDGSDVLPADAIVAAASAADWLIAMRPPNDAAPELSPPLPDLLLRSGLPVLVAPEGAAPLKARRIAVAWRDTRESRLAISLAMPLLTAAERVMIVAVREDWAPDGTPDGLAAACRRLEGHDCSVFGEVISHGGAGVARALDQFAEARGADLIVAGAYGHGRLREWALGGVTRGLIAHASRWILFCH